MLPFPAHAHVGRARGTDGSDAAGDEGEDEGEGVGLGEPQGGQRRVAGAAPDELLHLVVRATVDGERNHEVPVLVAVGRVVEGRGDPRAVAHDQAAEDLDDVARQGDDDVGVDVVVVPQQHGTPGVLRVGLGLAGLGGGGHYDHSSRCVVVNLKKILP